MIYITSLGGPVNLTMYSVLIVLFLWLHKKMSHAIQFVLTLMVGGAAISLLKMVVQLQRPTGALIEANGYSFASGHAAYAVIFFILIAYSYKSHIKSPMLRRAFVIANILAAFIVGMSRVYLGVHYLTDVLGGFALGTVISAFSILIFESYKKNLTLKDFK
jgi:undecaprenyl-diphosphatase